MLSVVMETGAAQTVTCMSGPRVPDAFTLFRGFQLSVFIFSSL